MHSNRLTRAQLNQLAERIRPMLGYVTRLSERMDATAFDVSDPLLLKVRRAQDALHELSVHLHYLSVDGAGRPSRRA
jgi:hypothetical protein